MTLIQNITLSPAQFTIEVKMKHLSFVLICILLGGGMLDAAATTYYVATSENWTILSLELKGSVRRTGYYLQQVQSSLFQQKSKERIIII